MKPDMNLGAQRLANQNDLLALEHYDSLVNNVDEILNKHLRTSKDIEKDKVRVAKTYNKK